MSETRDAATDPLPDDYLPPTNAGQADPAGGDCIAPEVATADEAKERGVTVRQVMLERFPHLRQTPYGATD